MHLNLPQLFRLNPSLSPYYITHIDLLFIYYYIICLMQVILCRYKHIANTLCVLLTEKAVIGVVGAGGLGLWAIKLLKALHPTGLSVCVMDRADDKLREAKNAGADITLNWEENGGLLTYLGLHCISYIKRYCSIFNRHHIFKVRWMRWLPK